MSARAVKERMTWTPQEMAAATERQMKAHVRDWYITAYPFDELGDWMVHACTFGMVYRALLRGRDVYDTLGVNDSVVRERVFEKLAVILDKPYDYVYNLWLEA